MQLYRYGNEIERQKLKSLLEEKNIPFEDRCFEDWGYNGVFRPQMGMGEIIVGEYAYEKARLVIKEFLDDEQNKVFEKDAGSEEFFLEHEVRNTKALIRGGYSILVILGIFLFFLRGLVLFVGIAFYILIAFFVLRRIKENKESLKDREKKLVKFRCNS